MQIPPARVDAGSQPRTPPDDRLAGIMLGASAAIRELRAEIARLAASALRSVLVLGETGVGKDLVAASLLACSPRLNGSVEVFNCPAIPADHLESELFGTTRGAYPGAIQRAGAAERAAGGVLMLDEIGAMPVVHQGKLLRLLESGEGRRLGATRSYRAEICFVAATNEDLHLAIEEGRFRQDLFYRLVQDAVLRIPPLRERTEDLEILALHFSSEAGGKARVGRDALAALAEHDWPGNVRELRAVIRSAGHLTPHGLIGRSQVRSAIERIGAGSRRRAPIGTPTGRLPGQGSMGFHDLTLALQRQLLVDALSRAGGNRTRAGVMLGFHRKRGEVSDPRGGPSEGLAARKRAHRKFEYWWQRLVGTPWEG